MKQSYKEIILTWFCILICAIVFSTFLLAIMSLTLPSFNCIIEVVNNTSGYIIFG